MAKLLCLHLADFQWRLLMNDSLAEQFPVLTALCESGESGATATFGHEALLYGSIYSGCSPDSHGVLGYDALRPDGLNVAPMARYQVTKPFIWDLLDNQGVACAVVNMMATYGSHASHSHIFSDVMVKNKAVEAADISVLPGSIYPAHNRQQLLKNQWHPSLIADEEIAALADRSDALSQSVTSTLKEALCQVANTQNIIIDALHSNEIAAIFACFDPLRTLFSNPEFTVEASIIIKIMAFIDGCIGAILSVCPDISVCITGGGDHPFVVLRLPESQPDQLLSSEFSLYDVAPSLLALFGYTSAELTGKPIYSPDTPLIDISGQWQTAEDARIKMIKGLMPDTAVPPSIEKLPLMQQENILAVTNEHNYHLAQHCLYAGRHAEARHIIDRAELTPEQRRLLAEQME
ncbi:MAG: hypothetical protein GYB58_06615 [Gammaproteobacteria bacterium]|nr:hypothetical protein [Gammaproteobacteria bacterium]